MSNEQSAMNNEQCVVILKGAPRPEEFPEVLTYFVAIQGDSSIAVALSE